MWSLLLFAHSGRFQIWCVAILASFIVDLEFRRYQVQAQVIESSAYLNQKLANTAGSSLIPRPFGESENHKTLTKVPSHMQSLDGSEDIRRFMWSEFEDTIGTLMHGLPSGTGSAHRNHKMPAANKIKGHRYLPAASTAVKYIIKKPHKSSIMARYPPSHVLKTPLLYGSNPLVESSKNYRVNYKMFEELALQEWAKLQKSTDILINGDIPKTLAVNPVSTSNSSHIEDWIPISIEPVKPLIKLHTDVRPFIQNSLQELSHTAFVNETDNTLEPHKQNAKFSTFYNQTANRERRSEFNTKSVKRENLGEFSKRKVVNHQTIKKLTDLHNADLIPAEAEANPISSSMERGQRTFRGSLKFGDKLLK